MLRFSTTIRSLRRFFSCEMASRLDIHFEISTKILKHVVNQIKSHFIGIYFVRQHHYNRGTHFGCTLPAGGDRIYSHHLQVIPQSFFKVYLSTLKSLSFLKEKLIYNQVSLNLFTVFRRQKHEKLMKKLLWKIKYSELKFSNTRPFSSMVSYKRTYW